MPRRYAENTENLDFFITILMPDKKKKKISGLLEPVACLY